MRNPFFKSVLFFIALGASAAIRADLTVPMNLVDVDGTGKSIGHVTISETEYGTLFSPSLSDLPAGVHGFHLHVNPSCQPVEKNGAEEPAEAAGPHYDPVESGKHAGPWNDGHRGDLPVLHVSSDGTATVPVLAPRLKMDEVTNKSLVIHAGGDNYSDKPHPSGGSGKRIACGVIDRDEEDNAG